MSKEQFEQELRRKLKGYQPEVDTHLLWQNIKQQQPKNYWGLVSLFMVAMSLGLGFAFWNISEQSALQTNQENKLIDDSKNYTLNTTQEINTQSNNQRTESSSAPKSFIQSGQNVEKENWAAEEKNYAATTVGSSVTAAKMKSQSVIQSHTSDVDKVALAYHQNIQTNSKSTLPNNLIERFESNYDQAEAVDVTADLNISSDYLIVANTNESIDVNLNVFDNNGNSANLNTTFTDLSNSVSPNESDIIPNQESVFKQEHPQVLNNQQDLAENALDVVPLPEEVIQNLIQKKDDFKSNTNKRKPISNNQQYRIKTGPSTFELTTEAVIGPMFPIKSLTSKNEESSAYLAERKASEVVLRGYSAEVNAYGGFKKHGYFKVGIDYAGFSESFTFSSIKTIEYWDPNALVGIEIGATGDTTYLYDSVWVSEDILSKTTAKNTFQMLDITTAMGYTYAGSKWALFVDAGLAYNVLFKNKGTYLNQDLLPASFNEPLSNGSPAFRRNLGVAVVANLGFVYEIKPNFNFKIQTGYKRYFNDFTTVANPIRQKYNFLDLGMGFQYTFDNF
jgi:hypothetical protein